MFILISNFDKLQALFVLANIGLIFPTRFQCWGSEFTRFPTKRRPKSSFFSFTFIFQLADIWQAVSVIEFVCVSHVSEITISTLLSKILWVVFVDTFTLFCRFLGNRNEMFEGFYAPANHLLDIPVSNFYQRREKRHIVTRQQGVTVDIVHFYLLYCLLFAVIFALQLWIEHSSYAFVF